MSEPQTPPPTLRDDYRYVVFRVDTDDQTGFSAVYDAAWRQFLSLLGSAGTAQAAPWIMKDLWNKETGMGGIRVTNEKVQEVAAALTLVTALGEEAGRIHVVDVTGTVKKAREQYDVAQ